MSIHRMVGVKHISDTDEAKEERILSKDFDSELFQKVKDLGVITQGGKHREGDFHKDPYGSAKKIMRGEEVDGLTLEKPDKSLLKQMETQNKEDWEKASQIHDMNEDRDKKKKR